MKATINGITVEGTPEEIAKLMGLIEPKVKIDTEKLKLGAWGGGVHDVKLPPAQYTTTETPPNRITVPVDPRFPPIGTTSENRA